jgi:polar amino acid transport system substrate-binding protein
MLAPARDLGSLVVRGLARWLIAAALLLVGGAAGAVETLTIGRLADSALADISAQVIDEAFRRSGLAVRIQFKNQALLGSAEAANDGETDGKLHRIADVTDLYPNLVLVPTPINRVELAVYGATPAIEKLSRDELARLKFAVTRGTFVIGKYSRGLATTSADPGNLLEMLRSGDRVDAVLAARVDLAMLIADAHLNGAVYRWPHVWASEPLYFVLNKRHAGLVPKLDAALQQMRSEGLIDQIYRDGVRKVEPGP